MFISDRVLFIELHKTGCTHIGMILSGLLKGRQLGKHNQIDEYLLSLKLPIIGSVRNPWEWYVSLWAYGCDSKGAIYSAVTRSGNIYGLAGIGWQLSPVGMAQQMLARHSRHPEKWKRTYADVDDPSAFREWLYMMHEEEYQHDIGEGYGSSPISKIAGLLTYRYLTLFCCKQNERDGMDACLSYSQLVNFEKDTCFVDHFIRNESLEADLMKALRRCGVAVTTEQEKQIQESGRTNASSRKRRAAYYYDQATKDLVFVRDKMLIDKFSYSFPDGA